jgi:hypothetical protein
MVLNLGELLLEQKDLAAARPCLEEALKLSRAVLDPGPFVVDGRQVLHQSEIQQFRHVTLAPEHGDDDVAGLQVAMDHPGGVRLRQRPAHLAQQAGDCRSMPPPVTKATN